MSLEAQIATLNSNFDRFFALALAGAGAVSAPQPSPSDAPAPSSAKAQAAATDKPAAPAAGAGTKQVEQKAPEKTQPQSLTVEVMKDLLNRVHQAKGRDAVIKALADVGANRLPEVKPERYPELAKAFEALLK